MRTLTCAAVLLASVAVTQEQEIRRKPGLRQGRRHCAACHTLACIPMNSPYMDAKTRNPEATKMIRRMARADREETKAIGCFALYSSSKSQARAVQPKSMRRRHAVWRKPSSRWAVVFASARVAAAQVRYSRSDTRNTDDCRRKRRAKVPIPPLSFSSLSAFATFDACPNATTRPVKVCRTSYTPGPIGASIVPPLCASGKRLQLVQVCIGAPCHSSSAKTRQAVICSTGSSALLITESRPALWANGRAGPALSAWLVGSPC